jgi:hypothetical protein
MRRIGAAERRTPAIESPIRKGSARLQDGTEKPRPLGKYLIIPAPIPFPSPVKNPICRRSCMTDLRHPAQDHSIYDVYGDLRLELV